MKIIISTLGTRGDIQPYIALALGLQKAGHAVTLATHPCMRGLVESYGVDSAPIGPDIDIGHEAARIRANAPHFMIGFMRVMKFTFAMLEQAHPGLVPGFAIQHGGWQLCRYHGGHQRGGHLRLGCHWRRWRRGFGWRLEWGRMKRKGNDHAYR